MSRKALMRSNTFPYSTGKGGFAGGGREEMWMQFVFVCLVWGGILVRKKTYKAEKTSMLYSLGGVKLIDIGPLVHQKKRRKVNSGRTALKWENTIVTLPFHEGGVKSRLDNILINCIEEYHLYQHTFRKVTADTLMKLNGMYNFEVLYGGGNRIKITWLYA
jgi:hypothetical protein